jgi:hypothetical protein
VKVHDRCRAHLSVGECSSGKPAEVLYPLLGANGAWIWIRAHHVLRDQTGAVWSSISRTHRRAVGSDRTAIHAFLDPGRIKRDWFPNSNSAWR